MTSYECTRETYLALLEQESELKSELSSALSRLGEAANSDTNTWHDNAAFDATNELIQQLRSRISMVSQQIQNAVIVKPSHNNIIGLDSIVTVKFSDGQTETFRLVGQRTASDSGVQQVSTNSPLGKALMGRSANDLVSYTAPSRTIECRVVSVE